MIEKKVYNGYAFSENANEKSNTNYKLYQELTEKFRIKEVSSSELKQIIDEDRLDDYDLIYKRIPKYYHGEYKVIKNDTDLTTEELLLIFDKGNLCFGGIKLSSNLYSVSED